MRIYCLEHGYFETPHCPKCRVLGRNVSAATSIGSSPNEMESLHARIRALEAAHAAEREAVRVLAAGFRWATHMLACYRVQRWPSGIALYESSKAQEAIDANPIASAAVRKAGENQ